MMINIDDPFTAWLLSELKQRDWSQAKLARCGGFSSSALSRILNGRRKVGIDITRKIANALGITHEYVMRQAGLLHSNVGDDQTVREMVSLYEGLPEDDRKEVLLILRHRYQIKRRRKANDQF